MGDIKLKQNANEILLYTPIAQKERAKSIKGWRWDAKRKCWVYPNTQSVFDALKAEFGKDLTINSVKKPIPPTPPIAPPANTLKQENEQIKGEITEILERLESLSDSTNNKLEEKLHGLEEELESRKKESARSTKLSEKLTKELEKTNDDLSSAQKEVRLLQDNKTDNKNKTELRILEAKVASRDKALIERTMQFEKLTEELKKAKRDLASAQEKVRLLKDSNNDPEPLFRLAKLAAIEATGYDSKFIEIVERLNIDEKLPIQLAKHMEFELRKMLKIEDRKIPLSDLLIKAKDSDSLPKDTLDLAHVIRKQRNVVAHGEEYEKTYIARVLMCLFAAALIWPELPE